MALSVCDLNATSPPPIASPPLSQTQKHNGRVPKVIYIEQPGQNDKCVITLRDANEDFIFMGPLHSRCYDPSWLRRSLFCVSAGHQTKDALLQPGNEEHQTPRAILEEGDHCDH